MTKYSRITGKVFGSSATSTGDDPQIGQFGSALAGTYNGTTDVATIQSLPAWNSGFIGCVTPNTQFPPLPEMTGFGKVLSHQICYLLQQGLAEWDSGTTYYTGNWCSYNNGIYVSIADENLNYLPTNTTKWQKFTGTSSRNLGEYVTSSLPLTDTTLHLADGSLLNNENYPELVSYISSIYNEVPSSYGFTQGSQNNNLILSDDSWNGIAYGNGKYVAISGDGYISTSTDGVNWSAASQVANLGTRDWACIAYGNNKFVAIGGYTTPYISTSTDGTTWTAAASIDSLRGYGQWTQMLFDGSNFVAFSKGDIFYRAESPNGTFWSIGAAHGLEYGDQLKGAAYGDGIYTVVVKSSSTNQIWIYYTSSLSYAFAYKSTYIANTNLALGFNGSEFVLLTGAGSAITSSNWNSYSIHSTNDCDGQAYPTSLTYNQLGKGVCISSRGYVSNSETAPGLPFITEAEWQSTYSTYGECGNYVYNSSANTVRIPLVNSYFKSTTSVSEVGAVTPASLPNIKGSGILQDDANLCSGALYDDGRTSTTNSQPGGSTSFHIKFDASRSNSIYSDSATTVNTQSIKQLVYIVVKK